MYQRKIKPHAPAFFLSQGKDNGMSASRVVLARVGNAIAQTRRLDTKISANGAEKETCQVSAGFRSRKPLIIWLTVLNINVEIENIKRETQTFEIIKRTFEIDGRFARKGSI